MIRCLFCGADNEEGNKFCSKCGNSLVNTKTSGLPENNNQQYNDSIGRNDPRRIDKQQRNNDPRRIDEYQHVSNQQRMDEPRGRSDPRRIDETKHVPNQPRVNTQQTVNNQQRVNNQQQRTNQNTSSGSGGILDKISNLSTPVKIIGLLALCCIGILVVSSLMGGVSDQGSLTSSSNSNDDSYGSVFDSFSKADCKQINYKELNKNPDKYYGENIKLQGRVMQISEGHSDGNYMLMYVDDDYNQLAYVEYYNDTNIVEDDYITVYGVCGGSYTYTTTSGGTNTVPSVYGAILQ